MTEKRLLECSRNDVTLAVSESNLEKNQSLNEFLK